MAGVHSGWLVPEERPAPPCPRHGVRRVRDRTGRIVKCRACATDIARRYRRRKAIADGVGPEDRRRDERQRLEEAQNAIAILRGRGMSDRGIARAIYFVNEGMTYRWMTGRQIPQRRTVAKLWALVASSAGRPRDTLG